MVEPLPGTYMVLGASGLAGYHALKKLADKPGVSVRAVHHSRPVLIAADNIKYIQIDLRNPDGLEEIMAGIDILLHFAGIVATAPVLARDPVRPVTDTLAMASNVLAAARQAGVGKVVWLSSTTGYPELDREMVEEDMFTGDPPPAWYGIGWMSRYIETLCRAHVEHFGDRIDGGPMVVTALRPTLMYGENDNFSFEEGHFLPAMIRRVVERHDPIEIWGDGEQSRDLIYAGDVVDAALRALDRQEGFDCFNISAGESVTVNEVVRAIIEIDSFDDARVEHLLDRPGSREKIRISNEKAKNMQNFEPSISLKEGLDATIRWYRNTGAIE